MRRLTLNALTCLSCLLAGAATAGEITVFGETYAASGPLRLLVYEPAGTGETAGDANQDQTETIVCQQPLAVPGRVVVPLGGGWRGRHGFYGGWGWGAGWVNVDFDLNAYYRDVVGQTRRTPRSTITVSGDY